MLIPERRPQHYRTAVQVDIHNPEPSRVSVCVEYTEVCAVRALEAGRRGQRAHLLSNFGRVCCRCSSNHHAGLQQDVRVETVRPRREEDDSATRSFRQQRILGLLEAAGEVRDADHAVPWDGLRPRVLRARSSSEMGGDGIVGRRRLRAQRDNL